MPAGAGNIALVLTDVEGSTELWEWVNPDPVHLLLPPLSVQLLADLHLQQKASLVLKRVLCLQNRDAMNAAIALHDQVSRVHLTSFKVAMLAGPVHSIPRQHVLGGLV